MKKDFKDKLNCKWKAGLDIDYDLVYHTECGHAEIFYSGGYKENHYKYCPYCGRWIKEVKS